MAELRRTLPTGIQRELDAAIQRTGLTPALETAQRRLPILLTLPPSSFEAYSRIMENAEADKKVYEVLDSAARTS